MAAVLEVSAPVVCMFCGQLLVDAEAVRHLDKSKKRFADQVSRRAERDALTKAKLELGAQLDAACKEAATLRARQKVLRSEIQAAERTKLDHEYASRLRSNDKTLQLLQRQKDELQRKVEKLSAPERGEFDEEDMLVRLRRAFPDDKIDHRGKGGDIIQTVHYERKAAGVIVYECKARLKWSNDFIGQVRAAGRQHRTPYVILVTSAMPGREKGQVCVRDDVVIVQPAAPCMWPTSCAAP